MKIKISKLSGNMSQGNRRTRDIAHTMRKSANRTIWTFLADTFHSGRKEKKRTKTHNLFNMNLSIISIARNMFLIKKRCQDYVWVFSMYFIKKETFQSNDTLKSENLN